jgi:hypothetical protein
LADALRRRGKYRRWLRECLPADRSWVDYFDLDHVAGIGADISPRFPTSEPARNILPTPRRCDSIRATRQASS